MLNLDLVLKSNDIVPKPEILEDLEREIEMVAPILVGRIINRRAKEAVRLARLNKRVKTKGTGA